MELHTKPRLKARVWRQPTDGTADLHSAVLAAIECRTVSPAGVIVQGNVAYPDAAYFANDNTWRGLGCRLTGIKTISLASVNGVNVVLGLDYFQKVR